MLTEESEVMSNCGLLSFSSNMVIVTCQVEVSMNNTFGGQEASQNYREINDGKLTMDFSKPAPIYRSRTEVGPEIYKRVS